MSTHGTEITTLNLSLFDRFKDLHHAYGELTKVERYRTLPLGDYYSEPD